MTDYTTDAEKTRVVRAGGGATKGRKGAGALKIERVHTTPGVHPYDEVRWERRDIVMTNWRDGSINFEQRGVEFPESWSVNATNIVTSKYFRGAVGAPQREHSLRQLIDRVVSAYVSSGVANGYFGTDQDAEIFGHELTWMLLHQVFSFNSPVWFNVGTSSPQQVSACLSVDSLVGTPAGLIPIGELVERDAVGTKVFDAHGLTKILATKANGVREVLRLHTKAGHQLDVTPDHVVWKSTGSGTGLWVEAGELRPGDQLEWHRTRSYGEAAIEVREITEASLAGWLQSEGFVGCYDHGTNQSTRGADMTVPAHLFTAPLPVVARYLRSLFQAEGYVSRVSRREASMLVGLDMLSEQLIRGVQSLLGRFGIFARVGRKHDPRLGRHDTWGIRIRNAGDRRVFADEIGFNDPVKEAKLEASFELPGRAAREVKRLEIARVEELGRREVYDIQTESGEFLVDGLRVHNCFILSVDDTMESILNWYREEGLIFKGGSGAGLNMSRIRSSKELLSSGGTASGPVSFMRGADASAGTIKSGGATRRAAKMVMLDVDHPDIEEFVRTKLREEEKIRVLRDAGFDMDLGGSDIASVQYQNANNSVRVSDEFMRAVEGDRDFGLRARLTGEVIETVGARTLFRGISEAAWACADPGLQYDDTINDWHTCPESGRITASNPCSEYLHLDNSSCNLASLNLLKFLEPDGTFDAARFAKSVELVITAMDISICFADFPTGPIAETTRAFRQLGIGYANLGALLMATGHAYDSEGGRALAAAITSLMTGTAYRRSAELAGAVGPYEGYARNAEAHQRIMRKHAAANDDVRTFDHIDAGVHKLATKAWQQCLKIGEKNGWRNAQASVLAPTGCLTGDTLITTDRGLVRLGEISDVHGDRWQDVELTVSTDEGPREATKFFVNGEESTRRIVTEGGYTIQGTLAHRVKVVDLADGSWAWKRLADLAPTDTVPMQLGTLVGQPRRVSLPVLEQAYYAGDRGLFVPDELTPELAELVGYFMGDGGLHAKGIWFHVADTDVVARLELLGKELFGLAASVTERTGYQEVELRSVRLARWWQATGFAKAGFAETSPNASHTDNGWVPRVPPAVLETNDPQVYAAFCRGLFEAGGTVSQGVPSVSTSSRAFAAELRTVLLALGFATTTRETTDGRGGAPFQVRLRNVNYAVNFERGIGFLSGRKAALVARTRSAQSGDQDRVYLPAEHWLALIPVGHELRGLVQQSVAQGRGVSRDVAQRVCDATGDARVGEALGYLFEQVAANLDGGMRPTFDLSVPENVTYVAAGFVSHNTIGLMMDCDTTGVEPDLALVKFKKLVGGGSMQIVNQTVPRALGSLGYQPEQVEAIVEYIGEHGHVVDAPTLRPEHYEVFDCAMGERSIPAMGHVRMMAAVQPFISGAISKTVNMSETASVEDVEEIYLQGWKLGLKALAIYRDNCKVGQPLSNARSKSAEQEKAVVVENRPVRRRLPKKRPSQTVSFTVGGAEGYLHAGSYPDDGLGEIFIKLGKQGSTLAGVMDAFSMSISVGLQYGIPLEFYVSKFFNQRFEPAGMTDDPDIRIATSVLDYLFRRLALDYLPYEKRAQLGIFSVDERTAQVSESNYGTGDIDLDELRSTVDAAPTPASVPVGTAPAPVEVGSSTELIELRAGKVADAPLCLTCGTKMRPAGSCYVCEGCGSTSGCS
jgi:ribonucleoside-diphosphate reductase alpha chain